MNSQTEERLRAAFEAKADQVTAERLDQLALPASDADRRVDGTGWISSSSRRPGSRSPPKPTSMTT